MIFIILLANMASKKKTTPPKFTEDMSYTAWKNKIEMWKIVTSIEKKEQGIVVLLDALEGNKKAEKAVADLKATDLHNDDGLQTLIAKLDIVFKSEKVDEAYEAYSKFISFQKSDNVSMNDYIVEYEHLYIKMSEHDMKLPDTILAFKLLDGAKLKEEERTLALAVANDLKFDSMKSALKRIFSKPPPTSDTLSNIKSEEEAFYTRQQRNQHFPRVQQNRNQQTSNFKGPPPSTKKDKLNPLNKYGQISRCVVCDSKLHWANQCPHNQQNNSVNYTETDDTPCEEVENYKT